MLNDLVEIENELRSVSQEEHRIQEHICAIDQDISKAEAWLRMNHSGGVDYQEILKEIIALLAYVAELNAQAVSLMFEEQVSKISIDINTSG